MPRNGSGTYSLPAGNPVVTHTVIASAWANSTLPDIGAALTNSIAKDGQTTPTANLPMGGFKHTGVALGVAATDYVRVDQVATNSLARATSVAMPTQNHFTCNYGFGETTFVAGQELLIVFPDDIVGTIEGAPSYITVNAGTETEIKRSDGATKLYPGDILANVPYEMLWTGTIWVLLGTPNPYFITPQMVATIGMQTLKFELIPLEQILDAGPGVLDFSDYSTQRSQLSADYTFSSLTGLVVGNTGTVTFTATNLGTITWPASVVWPLGVTPNLAAGTLKIALCRFTFDGTHYLGEASVY